MEKPDSCRLAFGRKFHVGIVSFTLEMHLRLCIWLILQGRPLELLTLLAPVCSTWSAVNLATSQRSELCPWGNVGLLSVRRGNKMVSRPGPPFFMNRFQLISIKNHCASLLLARVRVALLLVLQSALQTSWMVENPGSSRILLHPRLKWAINALKSIGIPASRL